MKTPERSSFEVKKDITTRQSIGQCDEYPLAKEQTMERIK